MAKTTALDLSILLDEHPMPKGSADRKKIKADEIFIHLFPKPTRTYSIPLSYTETYKLFTREQIREILIKNHLVRKGADVETATN